MKRLLHQGAEVDARESEMQAGTDSIQAAVAGGHLSNVECLTNEDTLANALASFKGRITALQAAADVSQWALVKRLLEAVIGIRTRTSHHRGAQRSRQQLKVPSSPPLSDIRVTPLKPIHQHLVCEGE